MSKKIHNKADELIYKAFKKAMADGKVQLCLVESKINCKNSPIYNPWDMLLPFLVPVVLGLVFILFVGPLFGLFFIALTIMGLSPLMHKKIEQRLMERSRFYLLSGYDNFCHLWEFGGIVLVNADNKKNGCIAPDNDWKEFVVRNYADLMTDEKNKDNKSETQADISQAV